MKKQYRFHIIFENAAVGKLDERFADTEAGTKARVLDMVRELTCFRDGDLIRIVEPTPKASKLTKTRF